MTARRCRCGNSWHGYGCDCEATTGEAEAARRTVALNVTRLRGMAADLRRQGCASEAATLETAADAIEQEIP